MWDFGKRVFGGFLGKPILDSFMSQQVYTIPCLVGKRRRNAIIQFIQWHIGIHRLRPALSPARLSLPLRHRDEGLNSFPEKLPMTALFLSPVEVPAVAF